jgi:putative addiction module CopG family antidote
MSTVKAVCAKLEVDEDTIAMNVIVSEQTERIIRSQIQSGRYASEEAVIEDAVRRLEGELAPETSADAAIAASQQLQRRLFAAGLLSEIKPPIYDPAPWNGRQAVPIEGEPLSETVIRERRTQEGMM